MSSKRAVTRRDFLRASAAAVAVSAAFRPSAGRAGTNTGRIRKALKYHMFKEEQELPPVEVFRILKDLGFEGVEIHRTQKGDPSAFAAASEKADLPIHGVLNSSNPDLKGAIDLAKLYGATSVLYVAGRVNEQKSYDVNYRETQDVLRKAIPYAEKHDVRILVENVWNNFLLSPLEMARYIDELDSPHVGVYFDVGNVVRFGWPEQWIRILGKRIGKLDIKEYSRVKQQNEGLWKGFQVEIGEGDCGWPEVRQALADIEYKGWATAEVRGGDRARLKEIADRMDRALDL